MTRKAVGQPVRGSNSGRPIMVLLDVLGQRWTLRILWELIPGPLPFRGLREQCDEVSPTVLNARLRALRELGLVDHREGQGYALTDRGRELGEKLLALNQWADDWAGR